MNENAKSGELDKQADTIKRRWEPSYGLRREDWPDPLREPYEPAQDELGLLHSQVPGHRWDSWRRLTGDEDYFAACSCGWRSTETGYVSPMLAQVQEHLDAVRAVRGQGRAPQAPGRAGHEPDTGQHEHTRELHAAVDSQHRRLSQALQHSTDLLSASERQADRLVAALQYAAAGVAPEWARTEASARRAEALRRRADRAKEVRDHIVAAAGALAAIAEEIALLNQDREARPPSESYLGLDSHSPQCGAAAGCDNWTPTGGDRGADRRERRGQVLADLACSQRLAICSA